jgi:hypothetical protein
MKKIKIYELPTNCKDGLINLINVSINVIELNLNKYNRNFYNSFKKYYTLIINLILK